DVRSCFCSPQLAPAFSPDQLLRQQHGDGAARMKGLINRAGDDVADAVGSLGAEDVKTHELEDSSGPLAHGNLPGIELGELAAHGDEEHERDAAVFRQREQVDAIADTARLHEERAAGAAEPEAGSKPNALLFAGQNGGCDVGVGGAEVYQARVSG